ncbi:MAG: SDR family oxidoreductase [Hyphomicrobiales bacterium]|nr:SDR family oxidoreductase [Hyphomicrobiales bacterium]MCP5373905.1 SDR family oxidoreductase [Hyphomicrobiales bacterium]
MPTVMITGAGRGLGLEFARQYAADRWKVIATCRDPDNAADLQAITGVQVRQLDITDPAQIHALTRKLKREAFDVLLHNAGIYGPRPAMLGGVEREPWLDVLNVNAIAPFQVTEAFLDHVARGKLKKIIAVTSRMGSMTDNTSGGSYIYRSSKAALNAVMKSLSVDLRPRGISVAVLHPGWVRTEMGGPSALISAEESVSGMRKVIADLTVERTGGFFNYDGTEIGW